MQTATVRELALRFDDCDLLTTYGAIAQLGERLLCKQEVVGSIPSGSTSGYEFVQEVTRFAASNG